MVFILIQRNLTNEKQDLSTAYNNRLFLAVFLRNNKSVRAGQ